MRLDPQRWPSPVPIAHRGSRLLWPENTLPAFTGAVELGYRHLETDLHLTADGVLVCIHDDTVDRTTDGSGEVSSLSLGELKALDGGHRHAVGGEFPFRGQGIEVPAFEEVVTTFPEVHFVVDLKVDGLAVPLAEMIDRLDLYDRILVGSFSDHRLDEFRRLTGGRVATSTGPVLSRLWVIASRAGRGAGGEAQALQLPTHLRGVRIVDEKLVAAAHDAGLQIHVWTVNREEEMVRLLDLGVDGLVTDRPDLLRRLLMEREQWPWD
ncbi:MAG: glycerophosphodiester phosphodiesterase [Acidimicrobiia bacterium]